MYKYQERPYLFWKSLKARLTESEVRGKNMNNFDEPGFYIAVRFKELVSEIVTSPTSGEWLVLLLRRIMKLNNLDTPVSSSKCGTA